MCFYRGRCMMPWKKCDNFLARRPVGRPKLVLPDYAKLDLKRMETVCSTSWSKLFAVRENAGWWGEYIRYIRRLTESEQARQIYARSGADWILPQLPCQNDRQRHGDMELQRELQSIAQDEMIEPEV